MMGNRPSVRLPVLAAWIAAGLGLCSGCGKGIHDGRGEWTIATTIDSSGDTILLDQARLSISPGTFDVPTLVTIRRLPGFTHEGAYGPVFEITIPKPGDFHQQPRMELRVQAIGSNQKNLVLGWLDPNLEPAKQQWVPISGSSINATLTLVSGPVQGFESTNVLLFGAIVKCPPSVPCPSGQACSSNACQKCAAGAPCTP
jgi:hypothetical protein